MFLFTEYYSVLTSFPYQNYIHQLLTLDNLNIFNPSSNTSNVSSPFNHPYPPISNILTSYHDIFYTHTGLPPSHLSDHHIFLESNTTPINLWLYRYLHSQPIIQIDERKLMRRMKLNVKSKTCFLQGSFNLAATISLRPSYWWRRKTTFCIFVWITEP